MADRVDPMPAPQGSVRTDDWPVQATDAIVKVVGSAHDKITGPITTVARGIAYGLLAVILGTTALVFAIILATRILNVYLPSAVFGDDHMWAADMILGAVFTVVGLFFFRKAKHSQGRSAA